MQIAQATVIVDLGKIEDNTRALVEGLKGVGDARRGRGRSRRVAHRERGEDAGGRRGSADLARPRTRARGRR
jgi:hypothetical protein